MFSIFREEQEFSADKISCFVARIRVFKTRCTVNATELLQGILFIDKFTKTSVKLSMQISSQFTKTESLQQEQEELSDAVVIFLLNPVIKEESSWEGA